jgi:DEAD/DEAH box helicase domain-containing protein
MLRSRGIERLYSHQAQAIDCLREGGNALLVTAAASGKSLCYQIPILEMLLADPQDTALLLFPTKALCQDQFRAFEELLKSGQMNNLLAGVYDGDTPSTLRRKLRDRASVIFTNPDMLHAALLPQHARWSRFLARLKLLVLDELHVYSGIFGSNAANLFRRFFRVCRRHGSDPQVIACSATIGNPKELAEGLTGKQVCLIDDDGSPRGERTFLFWNPPRLRAAPWRSRRSANVEAHELMAKLIQAGAPTITFSKAKMTAEMIYRYVCEKLAETSPHLVDKVSPYRGGYLPQERREIERRLFAGELLGVSATRALELGIDVGALEASLLVGYPGTLASFFQQSGRAGRKDRPALVVLVGLDTSVNQYVMSHPDYIFDRPVEQAVIDPDNPFVITGHLRCAAQEMPLGETEANQFGPYAEIVLRLLEENLKLKRIADRWYHAAAETPQHEVSLRDYADKDVVIQEADTGRVLGQLNKFDAPPILHPGAIYMHLGDTYRVLELDLEKNLAAVKREQVDYYTQPLGGTDVHHIDHRLREKPLGAGVACWGEVTAYFQTYGYEKVHFYSLDALSQHPLELPTFALETMALWIVPPESLMETVRRAGLDAHSGLRGIGYAARMLLPLFLTCDTLDFSHSVGSVNSPWNAIFIYERYPHGLGFTEKAYQLLHELLPAVLDNIRNCPCKEGCPCCVGKPLRQYATWNVERGEASIPSKRSAAIILEGLLGDGSNLNNADTHSLASPQSEDKLRIEMALRRRLERMREPEVFHPIAPKLQTGYPEIEKREELSQADVSRRAERRREFDRKLRKRIAKHLPSSELSPTAPPAPPPYGMKTRDSNLPPTHFPGRPAPPLKPGDSLAARARRLKKERKQA